MERNKGRGEKREGKERSGPVNELGQWTFLKTNILFCCK